MLKFTATVFILFLEMIVSARADLGAAQEAWKRGDFSTARSLLEQTAGAGNIDAQVMLAELFKTGRGGPKDLRQAASWYGRASAQDPKLSKLITLAQNNLAAMYWNGEGVSQDRQKATELYQRAAKNGHPESQFVLAGMYLNGTAVEKSVVDSLKWIVIAAVNDYSKAQLKWLSLQSEVSAEQIDEALKQAHALFPDYGFNAQETLLNTVPEGWVHGFTAPRNLFKEYIPTGQSLDDWTDMITVLTYPGPLNIRTMAADKYKNWKSFCGDLVHKFDPKFKDKAALKATYVILICTDPDKSKTPPNIQILDKEAIWITYFRGKVKTYEVQRAYHHRNGIASKEELTDRLTKRLVEWQEYFNAVDICYSVNEGRSC